MITITLTKYYNRNNGYVFIHPLSILLFFSEILEKAYVQDKVIKNYKTFS